MDFTRCMNLWSDMPSDVTVIVCVFVYVGTRFMGCMCVGCVVSIRFYLPGLLHRIFCRTNEGWGAWEENTQNLEREEARHVRVEREGGCQRGIRTFKLNPV